MSAAAVAVFLTFVTAECGGSSATTDEWLARDRGDVWFLAWTRNGDSITGDLAVAYYGLCPDSQQEGCTVDVDRFPAKGRVDGGNVLLTVDERGQTVKARGRIDGDELVLRVGEGTDDAWVLRFRRSTSDAFDAEVKKLREEARGA